MSGRTTAVLGSSPSSGQPRSARHACPTTRGRESEGGIITALGTFLAEIVSARRVLLVTAIHAPGRVIGGLLAPVAVALFVASHASRLPSPPSIRQDRVPSQEVERLAVVGSSRH